MATVNNKWSGRSPFIGIVLFILLVIVGLYAASKDTTDEGPDNWKLTGVILVLLCIFMWIKPWGWKVWNKVKPSASTTTSTTTTSTSAAKPTSRPISIERIIWICIYVMFGIAFGFWLWMIVTGTRRDFQSEPIDRNAPATQAPIPTLQYGEHFLRVGEARLYSHANKPEYFYPANNGTTVHFRICKYNNRNMYHDFSITRNVDGSIPDKNCTSFFNNLSSDYGYYTVEALDQDAMVTYSDHKVNE